jgi:hypothetical protein
MRTQPNDEQLELPTANSASDAFLRYHYQHPYVYDELVRMARRWKDSGKAHCSIKMLWEVLRYNFGVTIDSEDGFRLNNNYTSRYARLIMGREDDLADLFETRELQTH